MNENGTVIVALAGMLGLILTPFVTEYAKRRRHRKAARRAAYAAWLVAARAFARKPRDGPLRDRMEDLGCKAILVGSDRTVQAMQAMYDEITEVWFHIDEVLDPNEYTIDDLRIKVEALVKDVETAMRRDVR